MIVEEMKMVRDDTGGERVRKEFGFEVVKNKFFICGMKSISNGKLKLKAAIISFVAIVVHHGLDKEGW